MNLFYVDIRAIQIFIDINMIYVSTATLTYLLTKYKVYIAIVITDKKWLVSPVFDFDNKFIS